MCCVPWPNANLSGSWLCEMELPSTLRIVPSAPLAPLVANVTYTGRANPIITDALCPAKDAVILTLPVLLVDLTKLYESPFELDTATAGEGVAKVLLEVKFMLPPVRGYPRSITLAVSWSYVPSAS